MHKHLKITHLRLGAPYETEMHKNTNESSKFVFCHICDYPRISLEPCLKHIENGL